MPYPTKKLGEVAKIEGGGTPSTTNPLYWNGDVPWLTPKELSDFSDSEIFDTERKITKEGLNRSSTKLFPAGTVLFTSRAPIGYVVIAGIEIATNQGFKNFICDEKILSNKFLYYFLKFKTKYLQSLGRGATFTEISRSILAKVDIPIPPLAIQKQIVERLDKIAEAQKLNDGLIQKTDELFQSLLHKELNPTGPADAKAIAGKKNWEENKFVNCIEKNPLKIKGIQREKYQSIGKFPIIDQSDKFIVGYTDDENKVYKIGFPVIIFGDHTRIFKYIDFDFAIGADGTQIIIPNRKIFIPKFFYFLMLNLKINNLGYSRHFKILKTKKLIIPPLKIQKQIVAKLFVVQDYKKQLLEQKDKLKELFDSALAKLMKN